MIAAISSVVATGRRRKIRDGLIYRLPQTKGSADIPADGMQLVRECISRSGNEASSRGAPSAGAALLLLILWLGRTLIDRRDRLLPTLLRRGLAGGAIRGCRWGHRYLGAVAQPVGAVDNDVDTRLEAGE